MLGLTHQWSRKLSPVIRHIFLSHADRDHVCGLLQLHQLNASNGFPRIYFPRDCGSFPALRDFVKHFDPQSGPATWTGILAGDQLDLENGYSVVSGTSTHITAAGLTKALNYTVCSTRRVLKPTFRNLPGSQIAAKRKELGEEAMTDLKTDRLLGYSGDAPELDPAFWRGVKVLMHEATFLAPESSRRSHANLADVISAAAQLELEALILFHFSARYTQGEIVAAIRHHAGISSIGFPIHAIFPGQTTWDILSQTPVWEPAN